MKGLYFVLFLLYAGGITSSIITRNWAALAWQGHAVVLAYLLLYKRSPALTRKPAGPLARQAYFDKDTREIKVYDGSKWINKDYFEVVDPGPNIRTKAGPSRFGITFFDAEGRQKTVWDEVSQQYVKPKDYNPYSAVLEAQNRAHAFHTKQRQIDLGYEKRERKNKEDYQIAQALRMTYSDFLGFYEKRTADISVEESTAQTEAYRKYKERVDAWQTTYPKLIVPFEAWTYCKSKGYHEYLPRP